MKRMKFCLLLSWLLCVGVRAFAAPAAPANPPTDKDTKISVTQISLLTADGLVPTDRIIFNQNGTATRTTGVGTDDPRIDNPTQTIQLKGQIPALQFKRLVALIESVEFFKLNRIYTSYDWTPSYFVEVAKGDEKKGITVRDGNNFGGGHTPIGLWGLNMAIRGIAADIKWEKVEIKPENKSSPQ